MDDSRLKKFIFSQINWITGKSAKGEYFLWRESAVFLTVWSRVAIFGWFLNEFSKRFSLMEWISGVIWGPKLQYSITLITLIRRLLKCRTPLVTWTTRRLFVFLTGMYTTRKSNFLKTNWNLEVVWRWLLFAKIQMLWIKLNERV